MALWKELFILNRLPYGLITPRWSLMRCYRPSVPMCSTLARRSKLMAQFDSIKKQYKDYILLFQVGDFYEIYDKDASENGTVL